MQTLRRICTTGQDPSLCYPVFQTPRKSIRILTKSGCRALLVEAEKLILKASSVRTHWHQWWMMAKSIKVEKQKPQRESGQQDVHTAWKLITNCHLHLISSDACSEHVTATHACALIAAMCGLDERSNLAGKGKSAALILIHQVPRKKNI